MQHFDHQRQGLGHQLCFIVCFAGRRFAQVQIFSSSWPPQAQMILKKVYMSFHCNEVGSLCLQQKSQGNSFSAAFFLSKGHFMVISFSVREVIKVELNSVFWSNRVFIGSSKSA